MGIALERGVENFSAGFGQALGAIFPGQQPRAERPLDVTDSKAVNNLFGRTRRTLDGIERRQPESHDSLGGKEVGYQMRRQFGLPLEDGLNEDGTPRWPEMKYVEGISDMPGDTIVGVRRSWGPYRDMAEKITGVPNTFMGALFGKENRTMALDEKNPKSSATGPGQLIDETFTTMMRRYSKKLGGVDAQRMSNDEILEYREDPRYALTMASIYQRENAESFKVEYGRDPTWPEMRFAHFFGYTKELKKYLELSDSDVPAKVMSKGTLEANRNVFYEKDGRPKTKSEVNDHLVRKIPAHPFQLNDGPLGLKPRTQD